MPRITGFETSRHWCKCVKRSLFSCKIVISPVHLSFPSNTSKATMGTNKGSNAKKATGVAAKKKKFSTKVMIADPVSRPICPCPIAKRWEEWEDNLILRLRKEGKTYAQMSQHLSRRSGNACRVRHAILKDRTPQKLTFVKDWEDWEDDILVGFRKEGKNYAQICQYLSYRTIRSCRQRLWKIRARSQEVRTQKIDTRVSSIPKRPRLTKGWEDWEDQTLVAHRAAGWTWENIKRLLPNRTLRAVRTRAKSEEVSLILRLNPPPPAKIPESGGRCYPWNQEEDRVLRSLRESGKTFGEIAKKIPNRSRYACEHRFEFIRQDSRKRRYDWEEWEERLLVSGYFAGLTWEGISRSITRRTKGACILQWWKFFRSTDLDDPWTAKDLALLRNLRSQGCSWENISKELPGHSSNACRTHWYKETGIIQDPLSEYGLGGNCIKGINRVPWSTREVEILVSLYNTIGHRYDEICKHLPGRSAGACQSHLRLKCTKEDGVGGPPSEFWEEYFASKLHADTCTRLEANFLRRASGSRRRFGGK